MEYEHVLGRWLAAIRAQNVHKRKSSLSLRTGKSIRMSGKRRGSHSIFERSLHSVGCARAGRNACIVHSGKLLSISSLGLTLTMTDLEPWLVANSARRRVVHRNLDPYAARSRAHCGSSADAWTPIFSSIAVCEYTSRGGAAVSYILAHTRSATFLLIT